VNINTKQQPILNIREKWKTRQVKEVNKILPAPDSVTGSKCSKKIPLFIDYSKKTKGYRRLRSDEFRKQLMGSENKFLAARK
jgi:hypothetical protein